MKAIKSRERLTSEDKNSSPLFYRHLAAYRFCIRYAKDKRVLEVGCSDGYGSSLLAKVAKSVLATDLDYRVILDAKKKYKKDNLKFARMDALKIKLKDKFDLVISFQVIEHINDVNLYLNNIKKVLTKGGIFIFSTPNRNLRLYKNQKPWNIFHQHEYDYRELQKILEKEFTNIDILGLTATPAIYRKEIKRLNLRRLIARIDFLNIYPRIPVSLVNSMLSFLKRKRKSNISEKDYFVNEKNIDNSLDLIAICKT